MGLNDKEIIDLIKSKDGITPITLSKILNIKHSTARTKLLRLSEKGILISNYKEINGLYGYNYLSQKGEHDNAFITTPRIQNFRLIVENISKDVPSFSIEENIPNVNNCLWTIRINLSKSNNLTFFFSGEYGFDISSVLMYSKKYIDNINKKYNINILFSDVSISNMELFSDFYKLGVSEKSIFLSDLQNYIYKIYSKKGRLRKEERVSTKLPFEFLFSPLSNPDIKKYLYITNTNTKKINELSDKFDNLSKSILNQFALFNELLKKVDKNG